MKKLVKLVAVISILSTTIGASAIGADYLQLNTLGA